MDVEGIRPHKGYYTVKDTMKEMVEKVDCAIRGKLSQVLEDYGDIFPKILPYAPPPKKMINHEIKVAPRFDPPHKSPYRFKNVEIEELRIQVETLLEQG